MITITVLYIDLSSYKGNLHALYSCSLSSTLHLCYGWDPRTKVIACAMRMMCAKEFVIERYFVFHIIANMGFCFLVMMGHALWTSPKGSNASRDGLVKLWEGSFIICNTITL